MNPALNTFPFMWGRQSKDRMQEGMIKHLDFHLININIIAIGKEEEIPWGIWLMNLERELYAPVQKC